MSASPLLGQLFTFAAGERVVVRRVEEALEHGLPVVVDSGAWSVFTGASSITFDSHLDFVLRHQDRPGWEEVRFVGLDVIENAPASLANWRAARAAGARVEPTIHYLAAPALVDPYVEAGLPTGRITFGGAVGAQSRPGEHRRFAAWSAAVARRLPAGTKIHGLGVTTPSPNSLFPFDAVDSTYWRMSVIRGRYLPLFDESRANWHRFPVATIAPDKVAAAHDRAYRGGAFLRERYGVAPRDLLAMDDDALLALSVESHRRFAVYYRARWGSDLVVYLAASDGYAPTIARALAAPAPEAVPA